MGTSDDADTLPCPSGTDIAATPVSAAASQQWAGIELVVDSEGIRGALILCIALSFAMAVSTWSSVNFWDGSALLPWVDWPLLRKLVLIFGNLAQENNVAAWFSSALLLLIALVLGACFLAEGQARLRSALRFGWLMAALVFAGLSLDELGSLHEKISVTASLGAWRLMLLAFVVIIPGYMLVFALVQLRRCPVGAALVVLGIVFFGTIPVFEHYEITAFRHNPATLRANHGMWLALEEGAELLGMIAFLAGALRFLRTFQTVDDERPVIRLAMSRSAAMRVLVGTGVVGALGILAALRWDPAMTLLGGNGKVANWFASAPLLAASVALAGVAGDGPQRWPLLSLAGAGLVASGFVGADLRDYFWIVDLDWLRLGLAIVLMAAAVRAAAADLSPGTRGGGTLAGALAALTIAAAPGVVVLWLSLAAALATGWVVITAAFGQPRGV